MAYSIDGMKTLDLAPKHHTVASDPAILCRSIMASCTTTTGSGLDSEKKIYFSQAFLLAFDTFSEKNPQQLQEVIANCLEQEDEDFLDGIEYTKVLRLACFAFSIVRLKDLSPYIEALKPVFERHYDLVKATKYQVFDPKFRFLPGMEETIIGLHERCTRQMPTMVGCDRKDAFMQSAIASAIYYTFKELRGLVDGITWAISFHVQALRQTR